MEAVNVVVIGGGQAGLALSRELRARDVEHVVLERGRIGQAWRDRWDSFCLVTPNWSIRLPDGAYDGADPDGYLSREQTVEFLERYAARIDAPIREGVAVSSVTPLPSGGFRVTTSAGEMRARRVALASGTYGRPHRPAAETLPSSLRVLDVSEYRRPGDLHDGAVLVIGSGQSGLQIAEELRLVGRDVVVACGRAAWAPRRLGGRDVVWWASESGFLDQPVEALPDPAMRLLANLQNSGKDGGHDLNYRTLRALGVTLVGRFLGAADGRLHFASDLEASVAAGDDGYRMVLDVFRRFATERGLEPPDAPDPEPFDTAAPDVLPVDRFSTVIYAGGFRPAFGELVRRPGAFDELGFPIHADGESVALPGLHFIGVHFLRKRKSSLLLGVGEDAAVVAGRMVS